LRKEEIVESTGRDTIDQDLIYKIQLFIYL